MSRIRWQMDEINRNGGNCDVNQRIIGWRKNLQCPSGDSGRGGANILAFLANCILTKCRFILWFVYLYIFIFGDDAKNDSYFKITGNWLQYDHKRPWTDYYTTMLK